MRNTVNETIWLIINKNHFVIFKLMVPRQTYFPMVTEKVQRYFSDYVISSNKNNQIWLDYNGTPLKW